MRKVRLSKTKANKFNESGQLLSFYAVSVCWALSIFKDVFFKQKKCPDTWSGFRGYYYCYTFLCVRVLLALLFWGVLHFLCPMVFLVVTFFFSVVICLRIDSPRYPWQQENQLKPKNQFPSAFFGLTWFGMVVMILLAVICLSFRMVPSGCLKCA